MKILLLKTILPVLVLSIAFLFSFAQNPAKMNSNTKLQIQKTGVKSVDAFLTKEMVKDNSNLLSSEATPTDVPLINQGISEKMSRIKEQNPSVLLNN